MLSRFLSHSIKLEIEGKAPSRIVAYIPVDTNCPAANCGFDPLTHSARNPACLVCGGVGYTTVWDMAVLTCRTLWVDEAKLHLHSGLVSGEIGDVQLQGKTYDQTIYELIRNTDRAYILLDGQKIKPRSITLNKVEWRTSLDIRCDIIREGTR